jgi:hypothetical protein
MSDGGHGTTPTDGGSGLKRGGDPSTSLFADAYFSANRLHRYALTRDVGTISGEGTVTFIGLNPSTADETTDDPTIRRCVRFARDWGYSRLKMVNLYAFRATNPNDLFDSMEAGIDVVGPENDHVLSVTFGGSDLIVAAWGAGGRDPRLSQFIETFRGWRFHALGLTQSGAPRHPLYLRADSQPFVYDLVTRAAA